MAKLHLPNDLPEPCRELQKVTKWEQDLKPSCTVKTTSYGIMFSEVSYDTNFLYCIIRY